LSIEFNRDRVNCLVNYLASVFDSQDIDMTQLLLKNQHSHTTEFKRSDLYMEKTFEPKVFMPFYTAPHKLPRKVHIER
jgi:hypothetical protein